MLIAIDDCQRLINLMYPVLQTDKKTDNYVATPLWLKFTLLISRSQEMGVKELTIQIFWVTVLVTRSFIQEWLMTGISFSHIIASKENV